MRGYASPGRSLGNFGREWNRRLPWPDARAIRRAPAASSTTTPGTTSAPATSSSTPTATAATPTAATSRVACPGANSTEGSEFVKYSSCDSRAVRTPAALAALVLFFVLTGAAHAQFET